MGNFHSPLPDRMTEAPALLPGTRQPAEPRLRYACLQQLTLLSFVILPLWMVITDARRAIDSASSMLVLRDVDKRCVKISRCGILASEPQEGRELAALALAHHGGAKPSIDSKCKSKSRQTAYESITLDNRLSSRAE